MTLTTLAALTAAFLVAADAPKNAKEDLESAARKTAALAGYSFATDSQPGQGAKARVEGTYQKGQPVFFKADRIEFYQQGAALVYQQGGQWHRSKTGTQSDPLLILVAAAKVRRARLPHQELARLVKHLKGVKKAARKENGLTVYAGDFGAAGAKELAPTESANVAQGGTAKLWVNGKGLVAKYTFTIKLKGRQGNAEIDGRTGKTVALTQLGSAKLKVPAAAKKALE
jgi:hypothetical protein